MPYAASAKKAPSAAPKRKREGDPRELFARANRLYEAGDYAEALSAYEALVKKGYRGGNLYYNLGNTYFKLDDKGHAILYYEKARRLQPRDQDVASNLEYALSLVEDRIEPRQRSWIMMRWNAAVGCFTLGEIISSATITYWLLCAMLVIFLYVRAWRRPVVRIMGALLLILAVMVAGAFSRAWMSGQEEAVVLSKEAKVRYGPSGKDVTAFVLHEGAVVEIENRKGDWYQVSLPDGKAGWVEAKNCGAI
jgi:tetratricopeptide (TPR) repeat protein